ncbi:MAG: HAD-IA family hydrolase [Rhodobacteraceae bacterium]|nr:HAD-IA family hydrolase [Paracoccaceae bacterium]
MGTVVFDLDGTLADTSGDLIAATNTALDVLGHAPQLERGRDAATAFRGGRAMLRLAADRLGHDAPEVLVEAGFPLLLEAYGNAIDVHTQLYPGAADSVTALVDSGYRVAVCTNKPEGLARTLLDRLGMGAAFGALVGADTLPVRKPDPAPFRAAVTGAGGDPARSLLVGDTQTDRATAAAAGVPCVLVTFGPDGHGVAALKPDALLDHFDALPSLAARFLGAPGDARTV